MSCNQCEQTMGGTGCHHSPGICGKDADVQSLQETILYGLKGMAAYANFEQKAVAVLLTLLSLGVKGINLGPNPPAFITPNVFKILQDKFDLRIIGKDAKQDLARVLQPA